MNLHIPKRIKKKSVQARIPIDLYQDVEKIRKRDGHTWQKIIECLLDKYVYYEKNK